MRGTARGVYTPAVATEIDGLSLSLVGPGRAGRAFARSWLAAGGRLDLVVAATEPSSRAAAEALGAGTAASVSQARGRSDVLALAVPDDAIGPIAAEIAGRLAAGTAFHFSGALPSSRLEALSAGGSCLGSLHPLRVFSGRPDEDWRGAFVAIEGEPKAADLGSAIVEAIGGRGARIRPESKPLYHAAATLAAGGTVSLVALAARAWKLAGIDEEEARAALAGLAGEAAQAASRQGFSEALTGPIARRDVETVRAHREALGADADLLELYRLLAEETLRRTPGRGREEEIRGMFERRPNAK